MEAVIVLSERDLQRVATCSLFDPTGLDLVREAARITFRWALRGRQYGVIKQLDQVRRKYVQEWQNGWNGPKDAVYWKGVGQAATVARRTYEFLLEYEVERSFESYRLEVGGGTITGENAIVIWNRTKGQPVRMVVGTHLRRPRDLRVPNYPILAQWAAARLEVDDVSLGIVHVPLVWGERWSTAGVHEPLAHRWLGAMVKTYVENLLFPRVGPQCDDCTHPCKEVLRGPDDDRWT